MTFLLSASGMPLSNESSPLLLKVISFGSKIYHTLNLNVLLITASGVQAGGHLLKRVLGADTFEVSSFQVFVCCR